MSTIRPAGSGSVGTAHPFLRSIASPRAGLVIVAAVTPPDDWPHADGETEANLGHALGWTCEVRKSDVVLLDPLGEGLVKAPLPELSPSWLDNARHDGSCALYLVPSEAAASDGTKHSAELTIASAAGAGSLRAATVRTAVSADYGAPAPVGRNQPCPCGSGKKYKHCHG